MTPKRIPFGEFVALFGTMFALLAFSIDAMLPALPLMGQTLSPEAPNRAMLVILVFVAGTGIGTMFMGPFSDARGRKTAINLGMVLFVIGAIGAWVSTSLEWLLFTRFVQGLGVSAARSAGMAMIRDQYSGRQMARVLSFVMTVFIIFPAFAPLIGQGIMLVAGWRAIFLSFALMGMICGLWFYIRQPETLAPENRRALTIKQLKEGVAEMYANKPVFAYIAILTLSFGQMIMVVSMSQPIYGDQFGLGDKFPLLFGAIAVFSAPASLLNARLSVKFGMRAVSVRTYFAQSVLSITVILLLFVIGLPPQATFWISVIWLWGVFFQAGLTFGNINSLSLEPMGHMAGLAASIISTVSTIGGVMIAIPVTQNYSGSALPLILGVLTCSSICCFLLWRLRDT